MECSEGGPHFAVCRWGAGCSVFTPDSLILLCFALTDFALIDSALIDFALLVRQHFHCSHCCTNGHVQLQGRIFAPAFSLLRQLFFIDAFALYVVEVFLLTQKVSILKFLHFLSLAFKERWLFQLCSRATASFLWSLSALGATMVQANWCRRFVRPASPQNRTALVAGSRGSTY